MRVPRSSIAREDMKDALSLWFWHGTIWEAVLNCRELQVLLFGFSGMEEKALLF